MTQRYASALACLFVGCSQLASRAEPSAERLLEDSRRVAADVKQQFADALARALDGGNILRSFEVCRYEVLQAMSEIARATDMKVARVSLRPRNPSVSAADAWEQRVLREFEWRVRAGEQSHELEHGEVVEEPSGRVYRFMAAVPVHAVCIQCHGPASEWTAAVRAQLAAQYPSGYGDTFVLGGFGGAISIRRAW